MIAVFIFALITRLKLKNFSETPNSFQNFVETIVESMESFVRTTMGDEYAYFADWFFGVIVLIFCSNLSGLVGLRPPTADFATTFAFALSTFVLIHFIGITKSKKDYFKSYFEPFILFLPLNIIGELATPISLSFRLFGNILGGYIILGMLYGLFPIYLKLGIPAFLHVYFDIFSGVLQSYIFVILSMTFIRSKAPE